MYVVLSTYMAFGVCPLEDGLQVGVKIAGRLTLFRNNWAKVTQEGYRLELLGRPVQTVPPREVHTSSLEQNLVQEEIKSESDRGIDRTFPIRNQTHARVLLKSVFGSQEGRGYEAGSKLNEPQ